MKKHLVAVIGGACSGAEATKQLTNAGVEVVVFEQNSMPYGKIVDGLPRWHDKLQNKEKKAIDEKLSLPNVHFVPQCKIGRDLSFEDLGSLGFSAIVLGNGAWKDRPLRVEDLGKVTDHSFVYQNQFIYWFNHYHESNYSGLTYPVTDGAVVVGGGLASIDVAKVCQLEMTCRKLREKGHEADPIAMEHSGIPKYLEKIGISWDELELKPARLFYRRRVADMPLSQMPAGATPEKIAKVEAVRQKIIDKATAQYLFTVHPLRSPAKVLSENGTVTGIVFNKTQIENGRVVTTEETETISTQFLVSSIGSIPEPIPAIPMNGELYATKDTVVGQLEGFPKVFGVGNAITGKGNIQVSMRHGRQVGNFLAHAMTENGNLKDYDKFSAQQPEEIQTNLQEIFQYLQEIPEPSAEEINRIITKVQELQSNCSYDSYPKWQEKHAI